MAFKRLGTLREPVTLDTNDMMVPVLIPQTAPPAVTGWNSNLVVGGGLGLGALIGWLVSGYAKGRKAASGGGRKKPKKVAKKRK